jgi:hypothetical protein
VNTLCVMKVTVRRSTSDASSSGGCPGFAHSTDVYSGTTLNLVEMCGVVYLGCVGIGVSQLRVHVKRLSPSVLFPVTLKNKCPSVAGAYSPVLCSLGRYTMQPVSCFVGWKMEFMFGATCFRRVEELGSVSLSVSVAYQSVDRDDFVSAFFIPISP